MQRSAGRKNACAGSVLRSVSTAASFLLLVAAAFAALVLVIVPGVTGSQTYTVLTRSMEPHYGPGTLLVVTPVEFAELQRGDVVTYQLASGRPEVITHRIVSISADQQGKPVLITRGDNNNAADQAPVTEVQVRGRLFYAVPYAGYAANWLGHHERTLVGQAGATALIAYGIFTMMRGYIDRRRRMAPASAAIERAGH